MSHPSRFVRALVVGALAGVSLAVSATGADAHAIVKETVPAIDATVPTPPAEVVMRFNEPVELAFGAIRVYDTNQKRVDRAGARHQGGAEVVAVDLEPELPGGTYTVSWRVVSADGHPIHEGYVFHIGAPGARPEGIAAELLGDEAGAGRLEGALAGAARWVLFASLLVLVGAVGASVVWRDASLADADGGFRRRWRQVVAWSWLGAVIGTVAGYLLQGAVAGDLPFGDAFDPNVWSEVAGTRYGRVAFGRLAVLATLAVLLWPQRHGLMARPAASVGAAAQREQPHIGVVIAAVALAIAAALTPGLAGHAGTTSPIALNIAADAVHVTAAAVWLGGLILLLVAVVPFARRADGDAVAAGAVVARYSDVALVAIAAVVASGVVRSWVEVRELGALDESYGLVLLAKVAVFVPIVAAGFVNNRVLKPKLAALGATGAARAWSSLRRTVTTEVVLASVVVALTALLVNLVPARVAAGIDGPHVADIALGEYRLNVIVDPNQVGENQIHLTATTRTGAAAPVHEMRVLFRMPEQDIGPIVAEGVHLAPGHFVVQGRQLSVAGRWVLEVVVRTGRFDEERAETTLRVN